MLKMYKNINRKDIVLIIISVIFIITQVWLDLKIPDYMANITRIVQTPNSEISEVLHEGLLMLGCAFGSLIASIIVGYCAAHVGTSFGYNLRSKIFRKIEEFNMEEIKKFSTNSLITRNTNDVTQVQTFVTMSMQLLIKAPVMAIWAISKIADKGEEFTIITGLGVLAILILIVSAILLVLPKFKKIQSLTDNLNRITRENLTGIRVIRAFNAEKYQNNRFEKANNELTKTNLFVQKAMALLSPYMTIVMSGISLAIYWIGSYLINSANMLDKITIFGNMVVFTSYAMQVIMSFMMLVIMFIMYPRASVSAKRINEVLNTDASIKNGLLENKNNIKGEIVFNNVSFKYPDAEEYILENISFKINKGETIAFIGSTGSGKSTLINLIPRFYDATEGEIIIDGINIKDYKLENLYSKIGYISQKAILFKGTIKENIAFGKVNNKKVSEKDIKNAIKISQSEDFVLAMEDTYNAKISQSGTNISGGQKQRLSIARAIARNPEIYIFDDTFSALDYKTDFELRKAIKQTTKDATLLIVAQRIGTIKNADKIVVLENGKCVGIGKHSELLKKCSIYKEIASSQLSKEELNNE